VVRPGVRVLMIDAAERVLLFAGHGRRRPDLLVPAGRRQRAGRDRGLAAWGGVTYDCRERWFLARVAAFRVDTSGFTDQERTAIGGHRWWTLDDLAAASDRLVPGNLDELIRRLLRDGPPDRPIDLGP